jgi:hypothetical protein
VEGVQGVVDVPSTELTVIEPVVVDRLEDVVDAEWEERHRLDPIVESATELAVEGLRELARQGLHKLDNLLG